MIPEIPFLGRNFLTVVANLFQKRAVSTSVHAPLFDNFPSPATVRVGVRVRVRFRVMFRVMVRVRIRVRIRVRVRVRVRTTKGTKQHRHVTRYIAVFCS